MGCTRPKFQIHEFCFSLVLERATMSLEKEIKKWYKMPEAERDGY